MEKKSTENMPSRISVFMVACWFEFSSLVTSQVVVHTTGIVPNVKVGTRNLNHATYEGRLLGIAWARVLGNEVGMLTKSGGLDDTVSLIY